jgi:hypothetical protein
MIDHPDSSNDLDERDVQLQYLLLNIRSLLESTDRYLITQPNKFESRKVIGNALRYLHDISHKK